MKIYEYSKQTKHMNKQDQGAKMAWSKISNQLRD